MSMSNPLRNLNTPHIVGAVVTCGAVLGIASMIHPMDSEAVSTGLDSVYSDTSGADSAETSGLSLGVLHGRGFQGEIIAGSPEPSVVITDDTGTVLYDDLPLEEYLWLETQLSGDETEDALEAWPEALMDVDVPLDPW